MKMRGISIRRYKSLNEFVMENIGDLAVLTGENSSGKSNLLEALSLFFSEFKWNSDVVTQLKTHHWFQQRTEEPIEITIQFELENSDIIRIFGKVISIGILKHLEKHDNSMWISCSINNNGNWTISEIRFGSMVLVENDSIVLGLAELIKDAKIGLDFHVITTDKIESGDAISHVWRIIDSQFVAPIDSEIFAFFSGFTAQEVESIEMFCQEMNYVLIDEEEGEKRMGIWSLEKALNHLVELIHEMFQFIPSHIGGEASYSDRVSIDDEIMEDIISHYEAEIPNRIETWYKLRTEFEEGLEGQLVPVRNELFLEENRTRFPLFLVGSGHQSWLRIAWNLTRKSGIFVLEEPDAHFHPLLSKRAIRFMRSCTPQSQIIFTTHSADFLDACSYDEIWHIVKENGATIAKKVENYEELNELAVLLGVRPSVIFMSRNILFVEGPIDELVIESWARLLGIKLTPPRVSVIHMGGSSKAPYLAGVWAEAAYAVGIPMFVLLDGDKAGRDAAKKLKKKQKAKVKIIEAERVHNLSRTNLEDYYPENLFIEALTTRFSLIEEEIEKIKEGMKSEDRVHAIQKTLWELRQIEEETWKVSVANHIIEHMERNQIEDEIHALLHRIDEIFNS